MNKNCMQKLVILTLILCAFVITCKEKEKPANYHLLTIDISQPKPGDPRLSTIADKIDYIQLETNDSCLIGKIKKSRITKSGVYISDGEKILRFDLKGKFLNKIGNVGRGPGEYINILDFFVDDTRSQAILMQSNCIFVYSIDGDFLWKQSTPINQRLFSRLPDGKFVYLFDWPFFQTNNGYSLNIADTAGRPIESALYRGWVKSSEGDLKLGSTGYCALEYFNDTLTYWENKSDTVYRISDRAQLIPALKIIRKNSPPYEASTEDIITVKYQISTEYLELRNYILFPQILDSDGGGVKFIVYSKASKEAFNINHVNKFWENNEAYSGYLNDIDGGWFFYPKGVTYKGDPYSFFWAAKLKLKIEMAKEGKNNVTSFSGKIKDFIKNPGPFDNPIIMIPNIK
jgi:hypothetical protein